MSKRRKFSAEFKSQVVLQLLSGEKHMAGIPRAQIILAHAEGPIPEMA